MYIDMSDWISWKIIFKDDILDIGCKLKPKISVGLDQGEGIVN